MCEYEGCGRKEHKGGEGYCIFHCDKRDFAEKEIKKFEKEFWGYFEERNLTEWSQESSPPGELDFRGFRFPTDFSFEGIEFKKAVDFRRAVFIGGACFKSAIFSSKVHFLGAGFEGRTTFENAEFKGKAEFAGTKFIEGSVSFKEANFEEANFTLSKFFNCTANCTETKFKGKANFGLAQFNGDVLFFKAEFNSKANFEGAKFIDCKADFRSARFCDSAKFVGDCFPSSASFYHSVFEQPKKVEFESMDLSNVSFLHCHGIENFRFVDENWNIKYGRNAVYDEIKLDKSKDKNYRLVEEVYRKLRLNYERNLRFSEAGDFYIGEMEMRRKNARVKNKIEYALIIFYNLASHYGESYLRPLYWMFGITFLFALGYAEFNSLNPFNFELGDIFRFLGYFGISMSVFFQMPPEYLPYTFAITLERLLGALFVALFVLALRRKFKKGGE
ncbi:MAG: hypothetical protein A7316_04060 [Candidatus Altiarchaeales archaeon WOR_SM1_86-2]|nr:MAG: hypothetical protein A7316_04060 [Candidatus Altiarchaeales archaeon WOR_SM1_86-2]